MLKNRILNHVNYLHYQYLIKVNKLIKSQRKNPLSIPIIIINFNQLFYLKQLVDFLINRGFENIIIIDNLSTYPPLLEYYKTIKLKVKVKFMDENYGHNIMYHNYDAIKDYTKGYFVITDPDILPNKNLPINFMKNMIDKLDKYFNKITKVGFALQINDIPKYFPLRDEVINWENKFWLNEVEKECYINVLDTTFALYKPQYPFKFYNQTFLPAIRLSGPYTAKHGGWYKDLNNLTEEEKYYQETSNASSSWNFDEIGNKIGAIDYKLR